MAHDLRALRTERRSMTGGETHEVLNQSPPYGGINLLRGRSAGERGCRRVSRFGAPGSLGAGRVLGHARGAGVRPARQPLYAGARALQRAAASASTRSSFHPAYHALMRRSMLAGLHCSSFDTGRGRGRDAGTGRAPSGFYMTAQTECGHLCPMTMTNASLAPLIATRRICSTTWAPLILSRTYDQNFRPAGREARRHDRHGHDGEAGRQRCPRQHRRGPSRPATASTASPATNGSCRRRCRDAFLVLAQASEGLSCFLMPRVLPDGNRNAIRLERLKDKLGNRSNASAEVEFDGASAWLVGEPGRGHRRPSSTW